MRLFVCYAHEDKKRVEELVDTLRQANHEHWFVKQLTKNDPFFDNYSQLKTSDIMARIVILIRVFG
jgi:hypothetical protein